MKTLRMAKADPAGSEKVESVEIRICDRMPRQMPADDPNWRANAENARDEQALALCDVLFDTLPGGVLSALLAEMLRRKAGVMIVRMK